MNNNVLKAELWWNPTSTLKSSVNPAANFTDAASYMFFATLIYSSATPDHTTLELTYWHHIINRLLVNIHTLQLLFFFPCISINILKANIAQVMFLTGMKPNCFYRIFTCLLSLAFRFFFPGYSLHNSVNTWLLK